MLLRLIFLTLTLSFSGIALGAGESALMPGEVIEGHAKLEEKCEECHVRFDKEAQTGLCADCHKEVKADIQKHEGFHGRLEEKECRACHTEHKGRNAKIALLDPKSFNHTKTDFPLLGAHEKQDKVKCKDCHEAKKKYREAPSTCNGCHKKDDKHKGSLGADCKNCHNERSWKETKFDHSLEKTHFALDGKHLEVKCGKCHTEPAKYKGAPHECVACHLKADKHKGQYGKKCESCHTEKDWKKIQFDHDTQTKFKLLGKHELVKCVSCHKTPLFAKEKTPNNCIACHRKDDVHKGGLGEKCATCHNEEKWKSAKFDHDKDTKFSLLGKHVTTKCDACHKPELKDKAGVSAKIATTCIGCHKIDDKHKDSFGTKCETCHTEKSWKVIKFDHTRDTKYALKDKHEKVKCVACHTGNLYQQKLAQECVSCHKKDDVHKDKLGKRCESCHSEKEWKNAKIDHGRSRFPLLGSHIKVECKKCHETQLFRDAPSDCYACHKKDDDKVHKRRLGKKCASCHNARSWKSWDFDHDRRTKFKLDGGHKKPDCYACHKNEADDRLSVPRTCAGCHEEDDVHQGKFGQLCERCHVTSNFRTLIFGSGQPGR